MPLPPHIISLADLAVTVNDQPSESVEIRSGKPVWFGALPAEPTPMTITYSAVGKGLYNLQIPPSGILDTFHIDLTAIGSDVRMLELSLQPTKYARGNGQTLYTWDYKRLLFGQPIALDVLGVAPIDRLGELTWLGPSSVVIFGLVLGLVAHAFNIRNFDRWMLLLILGTFTGAYPLMYFAQEFIPLNTAIFASSGVVLLVIAIRSITIMGFRLGFCGSVLPAVASPGHPHHRHGHRVVHRSNAAGPALQPRPIAPDSPAGRASRRLLNYGRLGSSCPATEQRGLWPSRPIT